MNLVIGVGILVLGLGLFFVIYAPSTVTVGSGYIKVDSNSFSLIPIFNNEVNVTTNEIQTAFVGQVGSGGFALGNKQWGSSFGDTHLGVFTLGNGATADVLSTNSTSLIIQLTSGKYVIIGTDNTKALADVFAENVHQLQAPTG